MKSFDEIKTKLKGLSEKKRVGVVAAQDEYTLDAVLRAMQDGMIVPVLLGEKQKIQAIIQKLGYSSQGLEIVDLAAPEECALQAAKMVREDKLDCIMKGKIETGVLMKTLVNRDLGIRRSETMSMVAFVESPYYHKIFAITDAGLLTYPTLEQKRDAILNAVGAFHKLGVQNPKVAVLAAIEHVNPKMKETVEAGQLKQMWLDGAIKGCTVEGPISYDLSMQAKAATIKEYQSPVAGDADLLVVPDLAAGNILIKCLTCTGGAKAAGAIIGGMVPLILTSRSTSMEDKYMSILLNAYIGKI
jgi:phosphate butyryltransferase